MNNQKQVLILSHIVFRNEKPCEGPYSTLRDSLKKEYDTICFLLPLNNYLDPIVIQHNDKSVYYKLPKFLGDVKPVKYIVDIFLSFFYVAYTIITGLIKHKEAIIIGVDPLSALIPSIFHQLFGIKSVFYSIDFNKSRFTNPTLQTLYEKADEYACKNSSEVWNVCDALVEYRISTFGIKSLYMPNSFVYDATYLLKNSSVRTGNKVAWTGSTLTDAHMEYIVKVSKQLQDIRPDLEFWYVPVNRFEKLKDYIKTYGIKKYQIFDVPGQKESRELVSKCDLGIAIYDPNFGSTDFIEPLKIWEYMLCGVPFVISGEVSLNPEFTKRKVAFRLDKNNITKDPELLKEFIQKENLSKAKSICTFLAKKYDSSVIFVNRVKSLES